MRTEGGVEDRGRYVINFTRSPCATISLTLAFVTYSYADVGRDTVLTAAMATTTPETTSMSRVLVGLVPTVILRRLSASMEAYVSHAYTPAQLGAGSTDILASTFATSAPTDPESASHVRPSQP